MKQEKWQELIGKRDKRFDRNSKRIDYLRNEIPEGSAFNLLVLILQDIQHYIEVLALMGHEPELSATQTLTARQSLDNLWLQSGKELLRIRETVKKATEKLKLSTL